MVCTYRDERKNNDLFIDSRASKSIISKDVYDSLLEPRPPIQNTNIKFQVANRNVNKAAGMRHLPLQLRFSNVVKSLCLPVFVSYFLSLKMKCIFGVGEGRTFKCVHCYDTGTLWFSDNPNDTPLY